MAEMRMAEIIDVRSLGLPFRVGTTSYIVADDLVGNARFLAGRVQEMQLVLFDLPDGPSNLPDPATVSELATIGQAGDLGYSVHLIEDVRLGEDGSTRHSSLIRAQRVIRDTLPLAPTAFVLHAEGRAIQSPQAPADQVHAWQVQAVTALKLVAEMAGGGERLALENLEGYPLDRIPPVAEAAGVGRCVDVGHLWLDGHDPVAYLSAALPQARMVHLHGVAEQDGRRRDHRSLAHMTPAQLDPVMALLMASAFSGVVILEIFEEADFHSSLAALVASVNRIRAGKKMG